MIGEPNCVAAPSKLGVWFVCLITKTYFLERSKFILKREDKQHQIIMAATSVGTN